MALYKRREDGAKGRGHMRKRLREARKAKGLTQQQVADRLGISLVYYQKIESGDRTGDYWIWDALEDFTGIHQRILRENGEMHRGLEENQ